MGSLCITLVLERFSLKIMHMAYPQLEIIWGKILPIWKCNEHIQLVCDNQSIVGVLSSVGPVIKSWPQMAGISGCSQQCKKYHEWFHLYKVLPIMSLAC